MSLAITICSYIIAAVALPLSLYLGLLAILAFEKRIQICKEPTTRFAVVIPSHNEENNIQDTVASLQALDYPEQMRTILVIADNCSDNTAEAARAAGAMVWERSDDSNKGKGYALHFAFEKVLSENNHDAVVVVDADTIVSSNLLRSFDCLIASGEQAIQTEYRVRNVHASWRTKLMAIALGMFHRTRFLARERMKVSVGLRGNGMCFSTDLIQKHPHNAFSIVEDVEYGIRIGLSGVRIAFSQDAEVRGEMVSSAQDSVSQRKRWEGGRFLLIKQYLPKLLKSALEQRSKMQFDLALDLLVPPLSSIAVLLTIGVLLETTQFIFFGQMHYSVYLWLAALMGFLLYVLRGVQHSGLGVYGFAVLAYAPFYIIWKLLIARPLGSKGTGSWVRTKRENED